MGKIIVICFMIVIFQAMTNTVVALDKKPKEHNFDSTIANQVLALPLQSYIGKPVDSLLSVLPSSYFFRGARPLVHGRTKGIAQVYGGSDNGNSCTVEIYIDTFQYHPVPFYQPMSNWNMNLLKKETIAYIKVIKNDITCVYGCNNPAYF